MLLSGLQVGQWGTFSVGGKPFIVAERFPEDRASGITIIRWGGWSGPSETFVWDRADPQVEPIPEPITPPTPTPTPGKRFRPLLDRVLVRRDEAPRTTAGGLHIPDAVRAKKNAQRGVVVAVGPGLVRPADEKLAARCREAYQVAGHVDGDLTREDAAFLEDVLLGAGRALENPRPIPVAPGDVVWMAEWTGTEVEVGGEKLLLVREDDLLAVGETCPRREEDCGDVSCSVHHARCRRDAGRECWHDVEQCRARERSAERSALVSRVEAALGMWPDGDGRDLLTAVLGHLRARDGVRARVAAQLSTAISRFDALPATDADAEMIGDALRDARAAILGE